MKKTITLLLVFALLLSLAACAGGETAAPAEETNAASTTVPTTPTAEPDAPATESAAPDSVTVDAPEVYTEESAGLWAEPELASDGAASGFALESKTTTGSYGETPAEKPGEIWEAEPVPGAAPDTEWVEPVDSLEPGVIEWEPPQGQPFILTAAEWNDNANWPFFLNLVNAQRITFPAFGVDPRSRVKVNAGAPFIEVTLEDAEGNTLWRTQSNREGIAYLFYREGEVPAACTVGGIREELAVYTPDASGQGSVAHIPQEVSFPSAEFETLPKDKLQVMFLVDTTGSMADELAYLQSDFLSLAGEIDPAGVEWSFNFYRDEGDEYVTRTAAFSADVEAVRAGINAEYAAGGGDEPEAVCEILEETLLNSAENGILWEANAEKVAFLIFDAPPHTGREERIDESIRWAAEQGIHLVPVVCSGTSRETELFGRAIAIVTDGTYLFLTDDSGVGFSHMEPIVGDYEVELLHDILVRVINSYRASVVTEE